jgi:hypothetical protein
MKRASLVVLAAGACFGAAACGAGENPTHSASAMAAAPSFDLEGVAHEVVVRSARVQVGELVEISGGPDDIELMESIADHVRFRAPWVPAGLVTIALGDNMWAGGDVNLTFYHAFHLPGSTVRVDDRVIVEDGVLKL